MTNKLVKILSDDDGYIDNDPKWHLVDPCNNGGEATLCQGEYFGSGETDCTYETKTRSRGGITCSQCIEYLKTYKRVKL